MKTERLLSPNDKETAAEIMDAAYELLEPMPHIGFAPNVAIKDYVGVSGVCIYASDAVTRIAQNWNIVAARELHRQSGHHLTSFVPLDQPPSEEDLIMCLTWGQFKSREYRLAVKQAVEEFKGFFGQRKDIASYVGKEVYYGAYCSGSVILRQVTHTPSLSSEHCAHSWLPLNPGDVPLELPIGEVDWEEFKSLSSRLTDS